MHFATTPPSFLPTHPDRPNTLASFALLQKQKTLKILAFLGAALNKSLAVYALSLFPPPPSAPPTPPNYQQAAIEILSDEEEVPIKHNRNVLPANKGPKLLQKTIPPCKPGALLGKSLELSPTSEELHKETPPRSSHPSKTKLIKKSKPDRNDGEFQVEVPQVDPIETTSIPERGLSRGVVGRLREDLLKRQVSEWAYTVKKQKKEGRLFGD